MKNILGQLFTLDECNQIINSLDTDNWKRIRYQPEVNTPLMADYFLMEYIKDDFVKHRFRNLINSNFHFKVNEVNIHVIKYNEGQFFGRHTDRNKNSEKLKDFFYNINVVLNDEFEGGEFWLDDKLFLGNTPGVAYYYNSDTWHEVTPIVKGTRYSMLCYVRERDFLKKEINSLI